MGKNECSECPRYRYNDNLSKHNHYRRNQCPLNHDTPKLTASHNVSTVRNGSPHTTMNVIGSKEKESEIFLIFVVIIRVWLRISSKPIPASSGRSYIWSPLTATTIAIIPHFTQPAPITIVISHNAPPKTDLLSLLECRRIELHNDKIHWRLFSSKIPNASLIHLFISLKKIVSLFPLQSLHTPYQVISNEKLGKISLQCNSQNQLKKERPMK